MTCLGEKTCPKCGGTMDGYADVGYGEHWHCRECNYTYSIDRFGNKFDEKMGVKV